MNSDALDQLARSINLQRPHQQDAVRWALGRLIGAGQCGVVLADEVGCGKTYEALALLALLWRHHRTTNKPIRRVLVLCKPSLLRKWLEELTSNEIRPSGAKHGLRPYLEGAEWQPFVEKFVGHRHVRVIDNLNTARRMWHGADGRSLRGKRRGGKLQVPNGLYLVNHSLLYVDKRARSKPLGYLHRTDWDLVIVDEAHHYGKGNECDGIFASRYRNLGRGGAPDFGAPGTLRYRHILLLTATPFELDPAEMLNLLRLARADERDLDTLGTLLEDYQGAIAVFYGLRSLPPDSDQRRAVVEKLHQFRIGGDGRLGLEPLLRRYLVRNRKEAQQREYALVVRVGESLAKQPFEKFADLKDLCARLPLIPFTGPDVLFYLQLRELIQEVIEQSRPETNARRTFVAMDLQQGLSSYPQLLTPAGAGKPKRLLQRSSEQARSLRRLLNRWHNDHRLHPKVAALVNVVVGIVEKEIERVEQSPPPTWLAKIVVFNKLISGTAPHLRVELESALAPLFESMLERHALKTRFHSAKALRAAARQIVRSEVEREASAFSQRCEECGKRAILDPELLREAGFSGTRPMHAVRALSPYFEGRAVQSLFLLECQRQPRPQPLDHEGLCEFIRARLTRLAIEELEETLENGTAIQPDPPEPDGPDSAEDHETRIRKLSILREKLRSPRLVARYDGDTAEDRESNRINFNDRWNPLVLLVSRVGEEGIDLQRRARYILHYDLEWNPAKMEQREGRVDREGYGHQGQPIDVRFFLLKGTYEERIFHTVMQRDQWFQILMGAQRRRLGRVPDENEPAEGDSADADLFAGALRDAEQGCGQLTAGEKNAVMLDLRPNP
jgi:hypothetical protein